MFEALGTWEVNLEIGSRPKIFSLTNAFPVLIVDLKVINHVIGGPWFRYLFEMMSPKLIAHALISNLERKIALKIHQLL